MSEISGFGLVRLDSVCRFVSGGTPAKNRPELWSGSIPWISAKDMKNPVLLDSGDHISEAATNESAAGVVPAGSVLVLVRGMGLAKGLPVCQLGVPAAFNQDIRALIPLPSLTPAYLAWAIRGVAPHILAKRETVTHGTLKLDSNMLAGIEIPLPPLAEQERIAARLSAQLSAVERLSAAARAELAAIEALPAALLREAFAGGF